MLDSIMTLDTSEKSQDVSDDYKVWHKDRDSVFQLTAIVKSMTTFRF